MSTSSIQSTGAVQDLAQTIESWFQKNGVTSLSTSDFTGFLTEFLQSVQSAASAAAQPAAASATSAPGSTDRPVVGTMAGFDPAKLADTSHTSLKYQIGRVLQYYPNTPAGLRAALPELQQVVPGVAISGDKGDLLDFGSYVDPKSGQIGVVDVLQSAGLGGTAWQWSPVE